ncbi:hypothetical protein BH11BAC2_BH11BAC2_20690 [soil metagenome]
MGVQSQQSGRFWYFGNGAGLDFGSNPPTALTNGALNAFEGCATISDNSGILQFYTNGNMVWNRNHLPMPSGSGLNGDGAATQTAIIVPAPGNINLYYIFTVDTNGGPRGLCYSEVDMTLNGGLGDVTVKNVTLLTPVTEKLTAVRHSNGIDAWVIVHGWNDSFFQSFEITAAGVNTTAVTSATGAFHGGSFTNAHGYLKASPNAQKIACAIRGSNLAEVFDFNNSTGVISNPVSLPFTMQVYGVEFSPNNRFLYIGTTNNPGTITQYDLQAGSNAAIIASGQVIANYPGFIGALQSGSDGKIYVCQFQSGNLAIINNPDLAGTSCNFISNAVFLSGRIAQYGLPNFLQSFVIVANFNYGDTCANSLTNFQLIFINPDSVRWDFDDIPSGAQNTSTLNNPTHTYTTPGSYDVSVTVYQGGLADVATKTIQILPTPDPFLGNDISDCEGGSLLLNPGSFPGATFLWNDGSSGTTYLSDTTEQVFVEVTLTGCIGRDTLQANYFPVPAVALGSDITACEDNPVILDAGNAGATYLWQDGTTTQTYDVLTSGNYVVTVTANGCSGTDAILVTIDPKPVAYLGNDTTICKGFQIFLDATNPNSTYVWQDGTTNSAYFVSDPGIYTVIVFSGVCTATDTVVIDQQDKPNVFLGEDTVFCAGQPLVLSAYNYGATYLWQDGSTDSVFYPGFTGKYFCTAVNQCGVSADTVQVTTILCNCNVYLPNAFTPNRDTHNEIFNYQYECTEFFAVLKVYNRIGQLIFESSDPNIGWDGTYENKPATEGVYLYELKYKGYDDGKYADETKRGTFSLIR